MDPLPFPNLELLGRRYLTLLQAGLPTYIGQVEAWWADAGAPMVLPAIAQWERGMIPLENVGKVLQAFPACTVEITGMTTTPPPQAPIRTVPQLLVKTYVIGTTPTETDDLNHRYGLAVSLFLQENKVQGIKNAGDVSIDVSETLIASAAMYFKMAACVQPLVLGGIR
jgi:hypothetical protein